PSTAPWCKSPPSPAPSTPWRPTPSRATANSKPPGQRNAPRSASERAEVLVAELEPRRRHVLLQVHEVASSRNRQHHRRFLQQPRDRHLRRCRLELHRKFLYFG